MRLLLVLLAVYSPQAFSAFLIQSHSALSDPLTGITSFSMTFNESPDFFSVDEFGRPRHTFQYYIYGDETLPYPEHYSSIVRGIELDGDTHLLPIRRAVPASIDPASGGWGEVIGEIPYSLDGRTFTFSVTTALLTSYLNEEGAFKFIVGSYEYGAIVYEYLDQYSDGTVSSIPIPAAGGLFVGALISLCLAGRRRRRGMQRQGVAADASA